MCVCVCVYNYIYGNKLISFDLSSNVTACRVLRCEKYQSTTSCTQRHLSHFFTYYRPHSPSIGKISLR